VYRLTVLYGRPDDPAAFDDYYRTTHLPIAAQMRGLTRWTLTWTDQQQGDLESPVYLVVDLYAESRAAMDEILASEEGLAASADVPHFATGGVTFLHGAEEEVPIR
jgi:uncharacterized protein (TIGR02118 family)